MTDFLTRQELLRRAVLGAALVSVPGFASACGGSDSSSSSSGKKELAETLRFSNWTYYMDVDEKTKKRPTLETFKKRFGVDVVYTEDINSNSEYFGKIQGQLSRGQSIDRDLVVLTDNERYLSTMIDRGWAEKLDKDAIPNIENLVDVQQHPGFDSDREYSLPWQSGMTGIAYNEKLTKPITSVDQLLEDPDLKGRVYSRSESKPGCCWTSTRFSMFGIASLSSFSVQPLSIIVERCRSLSVRTTMSRSIDWPCESGRWIFPK